MVEVADIFNRYGSRYIKTHFISPEQFKVMNMIKICRTIALGGHMEVCKQCGYQRPAYNSCRNRHCPKCQTMAKEKWLNARRSELLPCGYFHLVFTIPHIFNPIILCNRKKLLGTLFKSVNEVLQLFGKDRQWRLNGKLGFIAVLHTWSQTLMDHFHLHCLIPAGALSFDEAAWHKARGNYLFKKESLAKAFKHRFINHLTRLYEAGDLQFPGQTEVFANHDAFGRLIRSAKKKKWIVDAKPPFAGPQQVLEYLGRYTHRVAISNNRIVSDENGRVSFTYRDRADGDKVKLMSLDALEFIRRFLLHVLPARFVKIRYYGFLSHRNKRQSIPLIRKLIDPEAKPIEKVEETIAELMLRLTGMDITCCPRCKKGQMVRMVVFEKACAENG